MTVTNGAAGQPPGWPERVRALARGELTPATPRRAATVLLLRDDVSGGRPAVHLLRRRTSMAFAGGMYAFPGGGVDPRDERPVRWAGPGLTEWSALLGVEPAAAQAIVCAAVRETFEESGVLLAGPADGAGLVADTTGADWEADRTALVRHDVSFAEVLDRRGLALRSDLLRPCARWVTPEFEERRYDTWFFLAALPAGQRTRDVSGEADRTVWLTAPDAVAAFDRGELTMLPPTITMLRDLLPYGHAADALAATEKRDLAPVMATATVDEAGTVLLSWPDPAQPRHVRPDPVQPDPVRPDPVQPGLIRGQAADR
ncbi:NUDIX hydrolase [Streptomyces sp. NPDC004031]